MMERKKLAAVFLAAALSCAALSCAAWSSVAADTGKVQIKIGRLREEIALQEEKLQESTAEEAAVLDELDKISSRMDEQQGK
ncbi:hypothetical protein VU07_05565, partial [Desulfobulbus sp. F4]|nr:hypothetical protein [Desulfobulbus sp. F4]